MIALPHELIGIVGAVAVTVTGDIFLKQIGKPTMAMWWDVICTIAVSIIGWDFVKDGLTKVGSVFGVSIR
jgi:hypothetical protein